ncbi:Vacuolar protein sorting-associated protein 13, partial [Bienertia sinuspersici]
HVGRLSIRIPWKKLGWDPIIIELEDVFFFAGPRDDHEWSADAVERRELAAKKAKLAAAELAKLSRRILDSIQISMRNVHVSYSEMQSHSVMLLPYFKVCSFCFVSQ